MCTRRAQRPSDLAGRPTEVTPLSGGAGRPGGRPFTLARSTGRSTGRLNGQNVSVGRSTGRAFWPFSTANGQISNGAINTPFEVSFQQDFQEQNFSHFTSVLIQVFKRVFKPKGFIFICFIGLENSKKKKVFGIVFYFHFYINARSFPKNFSLWFWFPNSLFLTLKLIILSYL